MSSEFRRRRSGKQSSHQIPQWTGILLVLLLLSPAVLIAEESLETDEEQKQSKFRDPEDGRFDIAGQILGSTGFVPLPCGKTRNAINYMNKAHDEGDKL